MHVIYFLSGGDCWEVIEASEPADKDCLTQVGRAMKELGVQMIPGYSARARRRSERHFKTWLGRSLPWQRIIRWRSASGYGRSRNPLSRQTGRLHADDSRTPGWRGFVTLRNACDRGAADGH